MVLAYSSEGKETVFPVADVDGPLIEAEQSGNEAGDDRIDGQQFAGKVSPMRRMPIRRGMKPINNKHGFYGARNRGFRKFEEITASFHSDFETERTHHLPRGKMPHCSPKEWKLGAYLNASEKR